MLYIFIDTNIVMHFKPIKDIDWLGLTNSKECMIVVPPVVVDELDSKKYGHSKKAERAQGFLKVLRECLGNSEYKLKENMRMLILTKKPSRSFMESHDLIFEENDQKLLATIIEFRNSANTEEILFCTSDIGAHTRAIYKNIQVLNLPEGYEIASELSEEEKEIRYLKLENEKLKSRIPKPSLMADDHEAFVTLNQNSPLNFTVEQYISERMAKLAELHPPFNVNGSYNSGFMWNSEPVSQNEMLVYNGLLEEFYNNHVDVFREEYKAIRSESLSYTINLILQVNGSVPADRVEVKLLFPEGLFVQELSQMKAKKLKYPAPPYCPRYAGDVPYSGKFAISPLLIPNALTPVKSIFDTSTFLTKKGSRRQVRFDLTALGTIKHQSFEKLEALIIKFADENEVGGFTIDYQISADNLPKPIAGKMNVKFNNPENQIAD